MVCIESCGEFCLLEEEKRSLKVLWRMEMMEDSACVNMSCLYDFM